MNVLTLDTPRLVEFFNKCHNSSDGKFCDTPGAAAAAAGTGDSAPRMSQISAKGFGNLLRKAGFNVTSVSKATSRSWKIKMADGSVHIISGGGSLDKLGKPGSAPPAKATAAAPTKAAAAAAAAPTAAAPKQYTQDLAGWKQQAKDISSTLRKENSDSVLGGKILWKDSSEFGQTNAQALKVWKAVGKNEKPTIGTEAELDALVAAGGVQVFRGLAASEGAGSAAGFANSFRTGADPQVSWGLYGHGFYSTPDQNVAQIFSRRGGTSTDVKSGEGRGEVVRMVIKPDAKVISMDDARKLMPVREKGMSDSDYFFKTPLKIGRSTQRYSGDDAMAVGLAKAAGYDVVVTTKTLTGEPYYTIMNRGAVLMSETNHAI